MERIGVRELRQHASRYLALVKAGETVEVTERGQLVALLAPPGGARNTRDRLGASRRLISATPPAGHRRCRRADQSGAARWRARGTAVIYLDSSALMKLVRREAETDALRE